MPRVKRLDSQGKEWRERRGSNAPAFLRFAQENVAQTTASQRHYLLSVNLSVQDERVI
jgi:hypothetical protein